jgi:hypothetical protein
MRGFIEVVSPSSHFLGNIASRVGFSSAEAKGLPVGKPVRPGGDILDRYSIPSKGVRIDPRFRLSTSQEVFEGKVGWLVVE